MKLITILEELKDYSPISNYEIYICPIFISIWDSGNRDYAQKNLALAGIWLEKRISVTNLRTKVTCK
jgi:hypothetical protein